MPNHRFKPGQLVRTTRSFSDRTGAGVYEIMRVLPAPPNGDLHYRVRGPDKLERAVSETQLCEA
jgi:hypothetical protein